MATIIPIAAQALALFETANTIASVFDDSAERQQRQTLEALQKRQVLDEQNAAQNVILTKQELQAKADELERQRRLSLKRAISKQNADFGSKGIATGDGSTEAVLLGLFENSDEERKTNERLDRIRQQSLDQGLAQKSAVNTLERTTLAEKQRLTNSTSDLDDISKLLSAF